MILADTSAWVEFDRATSSRVDQRITQLISDDGPLAVTQPVIMEVVAGARSDGRESEIAATHPRRFPSTSRRGFAADRGHAPGA